MKQAIVTTLFAFLLLDSFSQSTNGEMSIKDLAVPNSAAFILIDASPSNIVTPTTPKEFVFGTVQNFSLDTKWFQNYSLEFAPYWWAKPSKRDFYSFAGLKKVDGVYKQDIFSGLKFTTISMGFLSKDLVPDTLKLDQRVFSTGFRTTLIKVHDKNYSSELTKEADAWHSAAQLELADWQNQIFNEQDPTKKKLLLKKYANAKPEATSSTAKKVNDLVNNKPLFNWDLAGAYAAYGINDKIWVNGRYGGWTTLSSFIPLDKEVVHNNYFDLLVSARYLSDNYTKNDSNLIVAGNSFDMGAKIGFEFSRFSVFAEGILRKVNGNSDSQNRLVGIVNYKVMDNLFISGTFGDDFGPENKIISLVGINWGFGSEKINL